MAALQSGSVQAVTLWDPFLAAAESQPGLKNLRDGSGLSNNRTFYLSTASFADQHRALLKIFFAELGKVSQWANAKPAEVAALLAPQLGINANVLQVASERRNYNAVAITPQIVAEQQKLADTFGTGPDSTQAAGGRRGLPGFRLALSGAPPCPARSASTPSA